MYTASDDVNAGCWAGTAVTARLDAKSAVAHVLRAPNANALMQDRACQTGANSSRRQGASSINRQSGPVCQPHSIPIAGGVWTGQRLV